LGAEEDGVLGIGVWELALLALLLVATVGIVIAVVAASSGNQQQ